jgi:hypothetical protein
MFIISFRGEIHDFVLLQLKKKKIHVGTWICRPEIKNIEFKKNVLGKIFGPSRKLERGQEIKLPIPVAARFKAWFCGRSLCWDYGFIFPSRTWLYVSCAWCVCVGTLRSLRLTDH